MRGLSALRTPLTMLWLTCWIGLGACSKDPKPTIQPVRVVTVQKACIRSAPPAKPQTRADRRADGCPEPYIACYTRAQAEVLALWVSLMTAWADDAVGDCGISEIVPEMPDDGAKE